MMTKEQIKEFSELNDIFYDSCKNVCNAIATYDKNFKWMDTFELDGENVLCEGDEYWVYGGHENHVGCFNIELLSYSNEELEEYSKKRIQEIKIKALKEQIEKEQLEKKRDIAEYTRLKEKLGL